MLAGAGLPASGVPLRAASDGGAGDPDLALVFVSHHHAGLMGAVGDVVHRRLRPGAMLAVSAEAVLGGSRELEGRAGISILAGRFPGATVSTFTSEDLPVPDEDDASNGEAFAKAVCADEQTRAIILFADPFSVPMVKLLPALSGMCTKTLGLKRAPIIGGMASAGAGPGTNGIIIHKRLSRTGAGGVVIRGDVTVDTVVSQGCKPFGPTYVVTGAKHNVLLSLSGRTAMQALHEAIETLGGADRAQLEKGVFLGRVINEYKDRFGRGDFLIRNVVGVDQNRGALAVADMLRVGQTVQFHIRDAVTADEDLRLLLAAQRLREPPAGALLVTCNARGTRIFSEPDHDASIISSELTPEGAPPMPLAGFFGAGEIGPIGAESFLHGHTACLALFRSKDAGLPED